MSNFSDDNLFFVSWKVATLHLHPVCVMTVSIVTLLSAIVKFYILFIYYFFF